MTDQLLAKSNDSLVASISDIFAAASATLSGVTQLVALPGLFLYAESLKQEAENEAETYVLNIWDNIGPTEGFPATAELPEDYAA